MRAFAFAFSLLFSISFAQARTVDKMADDLVEQVRGVASGGDVGVIVRGTPVKFVNEINGLVRGRLEGKGFRSAQALVVLDPSAAKRGIDLVVELDVAVTREGARIDGTATGIGPAPWREEPTVLAHLHVAAAIDGELKGYLAPEVDPQRKPGPLRSHGGPVGDVAVLAIDVGDVDGDGRAEVVAATAEEIVVWRWEAGGGRWSEVKRVRMGGRLAAVRPRGDVGTIAIEGGWIFARSSRMAEGTKLRLGPGGEKMELFQGFVMAGVGTTCALEAGVDWFRENGCGPAVALPGRFWAAAGMRQPRGAATWAAVDPDRTLWIYRAGEARPQAVKGVGAQVAVAALERGEVVATGDGVEPGGADALVVRGIGVGALPVARLDRLPGAVAAIGAGDVDGDGKTELVAALRDRAGQRTELWIVY